MRAYFRNNAVNLLNLHYGIHSLALSGTGAFYTVFLLNAGVPVAAVLVSLALILFGRFLLRPAILPLAKYAGLKPLLIAGTVASGLQYPFLAEVQGVGAQLYWLVVVSAIGDTLYWTSYHAYFASLGDAVHRGQQIGTREVVAALVGIVAPLLAGWALVTFEPRIAFGATGFVIATAAVPLLWTPNIAVRASAPRAFRAALPGVLMFVADGWMACGLGFVWRLALFMTLGEQFQAFGGVMAIAALVGAASGLFLGRFIDAGHGPRAVFIALSAVVATIVLRAVSSDNAAWAIVANTFGALMLCLYVPTMMTSVYNQAKRSPCVTRFHIATEGGWDIGGGSALLLCAALVYLGAPIGAAVATALIGAVAAFALLRRYYSGGTAPGRAIVLRPLTATDGRDPEPSP